MYHLDQKLYTDTGRVFVKRRFPPRDAVRVFDTGVSLI